MKYMKDELLYNAGIHARLTGRPVSRFGRCTVLPPTRSGFSGAGMLGIHVANNQSRGVVSLEVWLAYTSYLAYTHLHDTHYMCMVFVH